jgi:hypothetical protein
VLQGISSGLIEFSAIPCYVKDIDCFVRLGVDHEHLDIAAGVTQGRSEILEHSRTIFADEID